MGSFDCQSASLVHFTEWRVCETKSFSSSRFRDEYALRWRHPVFGAAEQSDKVVDLTNRQIVPLRIPAWVEGNYNAMFAIYCKAQRSEYRKSN